MFRHKPRSAKDVRQLRFESLESREMMAANGLSTGWVDLTAGLWAETVPPSDNHTTVSHIGDRERACDLFSDHKINNPVVIPFGQSRDVSAPHHAAPGHSGAPNTHFLGDTGDVHHFKWKDADPSTPDVIDIFYDFRSQNGFRNRITPVQRTLAETALRYWEEASLGKIRFTRNTSASASQIINIGTGELAALGDTSGPNRTLGIGGGNLNHDVSHGITSGFDWMDFQETWDGAIGNGDRPRTFDYYTAVAHEIGHALGLGHTDDLIGPDIMDGTYPGEQTNHSDNDRAHIQAVYGVGVGSYVRSTTRGPNGSVYTLRDDNWLLVDGRPSWAGIKDFAVDGQGRLITLATYGLLERQVGTGWQTLGENVTKFAVRNDGSVFALRKDNWLLVEGRPVWANTRDFTLTRGGRFYWLGTDGLLQRQTASGWVSLAYGGGIWLNQDEVVHQSRIRASL